MLAKTHLHGKIDISCAAVTGIVMDPESAERLSTCTFEFQVPASAIDANGHVNNVSYVKWMQDAAIRHWELIGGMKIDEELNCTWVARSHHIEYLSPGYEGDVIEARTWIAGMRRVRSLRKYEFRRLSDEKLLARGETDWVFVDAESGRPRPIPEYIGSYIADRNP